MPRWNIGSCQMNLSGFFYIYFLILKLFSMKEPKNNKFKLYSEKKNLPNIDEFR